MRADDARFRQAGWFEVLVGKSLHDDGKGKCFAYVHRQEENPPKRMRQFLSPQNDEAEKLAAVISKLRMQPHRSHVGGIYLNAEQLDALGIVIVDQLNCGDAVPNQRGYVEHRIFEQ